MLFKRGQYEECATNCCTRPVKLARPLRIRFGHQLEVISWEKQLAYTRRWTWIFCTKTWISCSFSEDQCPRHNCGIRPNYRKAFFPGLHHCIKREATQRDGDRTAWLQLQSAVRPDCVPASLRSGYFAQGPGRVLPHPELVPLCCSAKTLEFYETGRQLIAICMESQPHFLKGKYCGLHRGPQ